MGADIVKVPYTGSYGSFRRVIEGCPVPVVIAGGDNTLSTHQILEHTYDAVRAGAAGISMGRPVFGHPHRKNLVKALRSIVHAGYKVQDALKLVDETV
jgi:class I fructose-bisphosphate aldolase